MVIAIAGTFVANRWALLLAALAILVVLLARASLAAGFGKFLVIVWAPTALMLLLIWGLIARAPPGAPMGSDPRGAVAYAVIIMLRLAVLGGAIQLALLSVPPRLLPATLRGWGIRGEGLVVALGVFAVGPEMLQRGEQVITARRARGLASGGPIATARELPRLMRPMFVWSIRSAVHRSEVWMQRALLLKVKNLSHGADDFWPAGGATALGLSILWLAVAIGGRWA
jgi:energy-coupling factor transporter transmembrane protein EcfT